MKIAHLSTYDIAGGAAKAAYRLHRGLVEAGVQSRMVVREKASADPTVDRVTLGTQPALWRRLLAERIDRFWRERRLQDGRPEGAFHDIRSGFRPADFDALLDCDLVHLHWTCGFLDWESTLPWLAERVPLVWTLHDMHAFLGVLNYGDASQRLPRAFARWSQEVLNRKLEILERIPSGRLLVLAPSAWMAQEARASKPLARFTVTQIPYGLDARKFRPMDRGTARAALGIPEGKIAVGFVAQNMEERRKGVGVLVSALQELGRRRRDLLLVTVGGGAVPADHLEVLNLGSFESEVLMNLFQNAIDLFVCPSLQDNLPNTVLEALGAGTPVVGFRVGGMPDMVEEGKTGWLAAPVGDEGALAESLATALQDMNRLQEMRVACRRSFEGQFAMQVHVEAIKAAYAAHLDATDS